MEKPQDMVSSLHIIEICTGQQNMQTCMFRPKIYNCNLSLTTKSNSKINQDNQNDLLWATRQLELKQTKQVKLLLLGLKKLFLHETNEDSTYFQTKSLVSQRTPQLWHHLVYWVGISHFIIKWVSKRIAELRMSR